MASTDDVSKVKLLTQGAFSDELIALCLDDAEEFALSYTRRSRVPSGMSRAIRDLAIIALNRIGTEGESSRSEAGESYSFESAPKQIYDTLNRFRLARVGGVVHEYKPEDEPSEDGDVPSDDEGDGQG